MTYLTNQWIPLFPLKLSFFQVVRESGVELSYGEAWLFCEACKISRRAEFERWSWMMVGDLSDRLGPRRSRRLEEAWATKLVIMQEVQDPD
jgi:hypothetical protein